MNISQEDYLQKLKELGEKGLGLSLSCNHNDHASFYRVQFDPHLKTYNIIQYHLINPTPTHTEFANPKLVRQNLPLVKNSRFNVFSGTITGTIGVQQYAIRVSETYTQQILNNPNSPPADPIHKFVYRKLNLVFNPNAFYRAELFNTAEQAEFDEQLKSYCHYLHFHKKTIDLSGGKNENSCIVLGMENGLKFNIESEKPKDSSLEDASIHFYIQYTLFSKQLRCKFKSPTGQINDVFLCSPPPENLKNELNSAESIHKSRFLEKISKHYNHPFVYVNTSNIKNILAPQPHSFFSSIGAKLWNKAPSFVKNIIRKILNIKLFRNFYPGYQQGIRMNCVDFVEKLEAWDAQQTISVESKHQNFIAEINSSNQQSNKKALIFPSRGTQCSYRLFNKKMGITVLNNDELETTHVHKTESASPVVEKKLNSKAFCHAPNNSSYTP